eukprot:TRINITY_DN4228_c0_g1_i1.p1 TRINITY_DN4228_c0_g1~~TRINITY_DN4228_c0_g1_i1.p1  ORF type:complete len:206 (+),score=46.38 TRINITY_DN4228_c0_g1_i1:31-648(+)
MSSAAPDHAAAQEEGSTVQITVNSMSGVDLAVIVIPISASVCMLKGCISKQEGTPTWQQKLLLQGVTLENPKNIEDYGPFEDGIAEVTLVRAALFIPAESFEGYRAGYAFKLGPEGMGYYMDEYEERRDSSIKAQAYDGYWIAGGTDQEPTTVVIDGGKIFWGGGDGVSISEIREDGPSSFSICNGEANSAQLVKDPPTWTCRTV